VGRATVERGRRLDVAIVDELRRVAHLDGARGQRLDVATVHELRAAPPSSEAGAAHLDGASTSAGSTSPRARAVGRVKGPPHHPSHRRVVRVGTPVAWWSSVALAILRASMLATMMTAPRYTRRPRNRSDGGVARLRQPSRPQQRLNRVTNASPAGAISAPRGFRP
jgi:hypothetical protein